MIDDFLQLPAIWALSPVPPSSGAVSEVAILQTLNNTILIFQQLTLISASSPSLAFAWSLILVTSSLYFLSKFSDSVISPVKLPIFVALFLELLQGIGRNYNKFESSSSSLASDVGKLLNSYRAEVWISTVNFVISASTFSNFFTVSSNFFCTSFIRPPVIALIWAVSLSASFCTAAESSLALSYSAEKQNLKIWTF